MFQRKCTHETENNRQFYYRKFNFTLRKFNLLGHRRSLIIICVTGKAGTETPRNSRVATATE